MKMLVPALLLATGLVLPGTSTAVDYWPMYGGIVYNYEDDNGHDLIVSISGYGRECAYYSGGQLRCQTWQSFSIDENGDLFLESDSNYCQGAIDPDYMWTFSPPVLFLDLPLEVGKSWTSLSTAYGYGESFAANSAEVLSEETVVVPAGTFKTLVVDMLCFAAGDHSGRYYLNRQVGPVILSGGYKLVSVEGIVPASQSTWGSLKSLYR